MDIEVTEHGEHAATSAARRRMGRRSALGAGLGGAVLSLLPFLSGRTSASATTDPGSTAPTTTLPPLRPTSDDVVLLAYAQQVELTALALYDEALALGGWSDAQAATVTFIREAHLAYGQSLSGLLGRQAPGTKSEKLFTALRGDFTGAIDGVLAAAGALESAAVATHGEVLSTLQGTDGAALIASIQSNEARYSTVLADLAGETDPAVLLVDVEGKSLVGKG